MEATNCFSESHSSKTSQPSTCPTSSPFSMVLAMGEALVIVIQVLLLSSIDTRAGCPQIQGCLSIFTCAIQASWPPRLSMPLSSCSWHLCVDRAARCTAFFNFIFLDRSWRQPPSQKNSQCFGQYPKFLSRMKSIPRIKSSCRPYSLVWPRISNHKTTFFFDKILLPIADAKVALWIFSVFKTSSGCSRR